MSNYKPIPRDTEWARLMIHLIKDGGVMIYPATRMVYRISRTDKSWTLTNPEQLADPDSKEIHERTAVVLNEIGWSCAVEEEDGHTHTCQQCGKVLGEHCDCEEPNSMMWCSPRCRKAFDL